MGFMKVVLFLCFIVLFDQNIKQKLDAWKYQNTAPNDTLNSPQTCMLLLIIIVISPHT